MESSRHNALIKITKITKESTSITALCETYLSWFKGRTRLQFCAKLWKWPQFHGKWYSTIDFTRRIIETFHFNTESIIRCILKIQVSRFGEMLTFCYIINENTQTEFQEDYIKKGNISFLLIPAEGNLNSSLRKLIKS